MPIRSYAGEPFLGFPPPPLVSEGLSRLYYAMSGAKILPHLPERRICRGHP